MKKTKYKLQTLILLTSLACFFSSYLRGSETENQKFTPYPIGYSIPEIKIVSEIPKKDRDFAFIIPGDQSTYIYQEESDYYEDYKKSFFAITKKKAGWDCMRHYEILANGCIPYFLDLAGCDRNTMYFFPRELVQEAMNLEGVSYLRIDHTKFNHEKYYEILSKLLKYTQDYLTTKKMASYLLKTLNYSGDGNILVLSQDTRTEYLRDLTLIGLKELLQDKVIDFPKIPHIYQSYPLDVRLFNGRGMTFTKILPDIEVDRTDIEKRITNHEFDLIIYAETHKGSFPFHDLVKKHYSSDLIAYIYCEETADCFQSFNLKNLFVREYYLYQNK